MSLADQFEKMLNSCSAKSTDFHDFVWAHKDAILTALRGRDAVLEEAANNPTKEMIDAYLTAQAQYCIDQDNRFAVIVPADGCAQGLKAALRAMKEGKQ